MRIAILTPVHGQDAAKAIAQYTNYLKYLGDARELRFFYHVSKESSLDLSNALFCHGSVATCPILVSGSSRQTSVKTCLNALIQLACDLRESKWIPDYVLWHSDSDLMIGPGCIAEMSRYVYGVGCWPFKLEDSQWAHAANMKADPRVNALINNCLLGDLSALKIGRTEASFMAYDLWKVVVDCILEFFENDYFDNLTHHWCAEEILLPSLAAFFSGRGVPSREQLCYTKMTTPGKDRDPGDHRIDIKDLQKLRSEKRFYAAKWFSPDLDDEARLFLQAE